MLPSATRDVHHSGSAGAGVHSAGKSVSGVACCGVCGHERFTVVAVCERPGEFSDRMICECCGAHHVSG